jgi:two-component system, OmpR family, sensor kinase
MGSIRFRLALFIAAASLIAVAAAGSLALSLRAVDVTLERALQAQRRLDRFTEVSARLAEYGLAAIDVADTPDGAQDRIDEARRRVRAAFTVADVVLRRAVDDTEGVLSKTEMAVRSRPVAQLRGGFDVFDRQVRDALRASDTGKRLDAIRGALNGFAVTTGPALSFLVEAERRSVEEAREGQRRLSKGLTQATAIAALVVLGLAFVLYKTIALPILDRVAQMQKAATAIGHGELELRLAIGSRDELGLLAATFNRMTARLRRRELRLAAERRALEETVAERTAALSAANERLEGVDRSRRRFFTDVSHELRTPLTVILGECDLALRANPAPADEHRPVLTVIRNRAQRLNRRIEDLLRVARSESGMLELDLRRVALMDIVNSAIESFDVIARRKGIAIRCDLPPTAIDVTADREWLRQVIEALIDNSLRHGTGATAIELSIVDGSADVSIVVGDDGRGFPRGDSEALFTRFARERGSSGFGIGLALARWVVERHGGDIVIDGDSAHSPGSRVVITMPKASRGGHSQ